MLFAIVFKISKGNSNYRYMLNSEIKSEGLVRQSLRTMEGWALSVEGLTMVANEEVVTV